MVGIKYCGDTPFKAMLIFVKFALEMTVKTSWVGGNTDIFMPVSSADGLDFIVAV